MYVRAEVELRTGKRTNHFHKVALFSNTANRIFLDLILGSIRHRNPGPWLRNWPFTEQLAEEFGELRVSLRLYDEMPMVGHDNIRINGKRNPAIRQSKYAIKGFIVTFLFKQGQSRNSSIDHMKASSRRAVSWSSWHQHTLPNPTRQNNELRPLLLHSGRDVDGDNLTDIVWGMGHGFGLSWLKQSTTDDGKREWTKHSIDDTFSQVHTLVFANLDGKGEPELITGKRVYAHEVEPGDTDASVVFYYQFDRAAAKWNKHTIFHGDPAVNAPKDAKDRWALKDFPKGSAGTGLQMAAIDMDGDGDTDLVCPGKSGLYLFENLGR